MNDKKRKSGVVKVWIADKNWNVKGRFIYCEPKKADFFNKKFALLPWSEYLRLKREVKFWKAYDSRRILMEKPIQPKRKTKEGKSK